jgi:hypothetical protein
VRLSRKHLEISNKERKKLKIFEKKLKTGFTF